TQTAPCNREAVPQHAHAAHPHPPCCQGPPPHTRSAASRSPPPARPQPPAPHPHGCAEPPRSPRAQCGTRAASPDRPHAPQTPEPRPHASAQGPRSGTSGCRFPHTGPQQTAPPSVQHDADTHAPAPPPNCKAPRIPQPEQPAASRPTHKPACSRSDDQSEIAPASLLSCYKNQNLH